MATDLYQSVTRAISLRDFSTVFYGHVAKDPVLKPLFPSKSFRCAIEEFSAFLNQLLDGPPEETQFRWWISLRESHARFRINAGHRDAWLRCMHAALEETPFDEATRATLLGFFDRASAGVVNAGPAPEAEELPPLRGDIAERWSRQQTIEGIIAALRANDIPQAMELAATIPPSAQILGQFVRVGARDWVLDGLRANPGLIHERFAGRTLLHDAASAGDAATVKLILGLGADPNNLTNGGHTPLYCLANECVPPNGAEAAIVLHQAGADVNACANSKRCTPLHMAARRNNAAVAEALIRLGANREARDTNGVTPLQRARNTKSHLVVALLQNKSAG